MARLLRPHDRTLSGKPVRLISETNEQLGIVSFEDAIARADAAGMDLVEVAPQATPPVCRIMNYGKFLYAESKKQRDAKKKQHQHKVKEIKFHPNIDHHDYETKLNHLVAFLEKGYKVKVSMFFRGREMAHRDIGMDVMNRVVTDVEKVAQVEAPPRQAGRSIVMMLAPSARA